MGAAMLLLCFSDMIQTVIVSSWPSDEGNSVTLGFSTYSRGSKRVWIPRQIWERMKNRLWRISR